ADVSCLRCHRVGPRGGLVGPDLSDVGKRLDRAKLLESIVEPNRTIAEGFETVVVVKKDGSTVTGVKSSEDDATLVLMNAKAERIVIAKKDILAQQRDETSAMPANLIEYLSLDEIRDLVEFLSRRRSAPAGD
ncbi:MAG: glucose dehydrogenase, partial [Planctomycetota bacterium]